MLPSIFGENLFDDFFGDSFEKSFFGAHNPLYGKNAKNMLKTDVKETESGYSLAVDLPGFKKEDVHIDLQNGYLTIQAEKALNKEEKDEKSKYIRQERYSGSCARSFYVGDIRPEDIHAKYENGVLCLSVPKDNIKKLPEQTHIAIE